MAENFDMPLSNNVFWAVALKKILFGSLVLLMILLFGISTFDHRPTDSVLNDSF